MLQIRKGDNSRMSDDFEAESQEALQEAEELKKPGVGEEFKTVDELREDLLS